MANKRFRMLTEQILFYSDGKVSESMASKEATEYYRRKRFISLFTHEPSISSTGKKLAYKCLGMPYC